MRSFLQILATMLIGIALPAGRVAAQVSTTCAECGLTMPPATPVSASQAPQILPTAQGFVRITLSGVATGYTLANGVYFGWCGDDSNTAVRSTASATPYSTYSPSLPANIQSAQWPKVNYILNHKQGGWRDVQHAIWTVLRGTVDSTRLLSFPATPAALAMIADAQTNGASFVPGPGQVMAVVLYQDGFGPTGGAQDTLVEVRVPECGVIGDFVWQDTNRNGLQDESGTGINGVTVRLRDASGSQIALTTTSQFAGQNGWYRFAGLCSGTYGVTVDTPGGMVQTFAPGGSDPTADSNSQPAFATLNVTQEATRRDLTLDFGFNTPACEARLGDLVWLDANQNGIQDIGENGIAGVELNLTGPGVTRMTTTDGSGNYAFSGLCAGAYTVTVNPATLPARYTQTSSMSGDDRAADSNGSPATVSLPTNTSDTSLDFGYKPPCTGTIGNLIWMDTDLDGIQDLNEPGIHGLTVELRQNNVTIQTQQTVNGAYLFSGVCAGSYNVVVNEATLPGGVTRTESPDGSHPSVDSNPHPAPVLLPTNMSSDVTVDFGYQPPPCTAAMGDFVWFDTNGDGVQNAGELGIPGVKVELYTTQGVLHRSGITDASGKYYFENLCADKYKVRVYNPSTSPTSPYPGLQLSPVNAVTNPAADSNPNNDTVVLGYNTVDRTYDFGFRSGGYCTRTQGYWKNHEEVWPVNSLTIGDRTYTKSELLALFRTPVRGDSSISLAHQLIAAKLNFYAGAAVPATVPGWFASADGLLSGFGKKLPYDVKSAAMDTLGGQLDAYNNGQITGASHCDDSSASGGNNGGGNNGGGSTPPPNDGCHFTQGYWKNHEEAWPVSSLTIGGKTYSKAELLAIFDMPVKGDASLNLAHQMIAAKLNVLNGGSTSIVVKIAEADALLSTYAGKLPYAVSSTSTNGVKMVSVAGTLDTYNNLKTNCTDAGDNGKGKNK